jgi:hypothetical protein
MNELVTAAQIIVGSQSVGWFADKLLGPSFDGLGEQFKAFAGARLNKIFGRANEKVQLDCVVALPPGFALTFVQKASFSEEDDLLTEMWSSLLACAGTKYESRQASYVDILSQMTAADARFLDDIVPLGGEGTLSAIRAVNEKIDTKVRLAKQINNISADEEAGLNEIQRLYNLDLGWPGQVNSARVYYANDGQNHLLSGGRPYDTSAQDNLVRLGVLETFEVSNSLTPMDVGFEGVFLTTLGLGLLRSCRSAQ